MDINLKNILTENNVNIQQIDPEIVKRSRLIVTTTNTLIDPITGKKYLINKTIKNYNSAPLYRQSKSKKASATDFETPDKAVVVKKFFCLKHSNGAGPIEDITKISTSADLTTLNIDVEGIGLVDISSKKRGNNSKKLKISENEQFEIDVNKKLAIIYDAKERIITKKGIPWTVYNILPKLTEKEYSFSKSDKHSNNTILNTLDSLQVKAHVNAIIKRFHPDINQDKSNSILQKLHELTQYLNQLKELHEYIVKHVAYLNDKVMIKPEFFPEKFLK